MRQNRYFLLGLLTLIGVLNFMDRQILAILLESIKEDLQLSDRQLGLLSGTLFALFYSAFGIPIAMLSDRWHRGRIMSLSLLLWSSMTVVSAWAGSFLHLILARIGVGLGEAGVAPAAHSMISENFEPRHRPTAFAIYAVGGTFGILLALGLGGWINQHYGWRTAFIVAGLPGILLSVFAWFLIRESRNVPALSRNMFTRKAGQPTYLQALKQLWALKAWRHAAIATAITHVATVGIGQFLPSLMSRSFKLESGEIGLILSLVIGVGGSVGALLGGVVSGRLSASRGIGWMSWTLCFAFICAGLLAPLGLMQMGLTEFVLLMTPYYVLTLTSSGVQFAIVQTMVRDDIRAISSALLILIINLSGLGLGPLLVGQLSDVLAPAAGAESLRYAMIAVTPLLFWGALHFYIAGHSLGGDALDQPGAAKRGLHA